MPIRGTTAMTRKLQTIARIYPDKIANAIHAEAEIEMIESKRRCPVSPVPAPPGVVPGTLRASGQVSEPDIRGKHIDVTMSYGGIGSGAEDYAIVQHEHLEFFHTTGQAKYLESVLNESRPHMAGRIARRVHLNTLRVTG